MTEKKKQIPCEVYSRIVGYLRPVQNWNKGKQQEFEDRQTYRLERVSEPECTSKAG
jgi:anaerobic ribonucleoside-triphosphate reductase